MFGRIGIPELILILVIALIVFGPSKLPQIGKSFGQAIREFRKGTTELQNELNEVTAPVEAAAAPPPPPPAAPAAAAPAATAGAETAAPAGAAPANKEVEG